MRLTWYRKSSQSFGNVTYPATVGVKIQLGKRSVGAIRVVPALTLGTLICLLVGCAVAYCFRITDRDSAECYGPF